MWFITIVFVVAIVVGVYQVYNPITSTAKSWSMEKRVKYVGSRLLFIFIVWLIAITAQVMTS